MDDMKSDHQDHSVEYSAIEHRHQENPHGKMESSERCEDESKQGMKCDSSESHGDIHKYSSKHIVSSDDENIEDDFHVLDLVKIENPTEEKCDFHSAPSDEVTNKRSPSSDQSRSLPYGDEQLGYDDKQHDLNRNFICPKFDSSTTHNTIIHRHSPDGETDTFTGYIHKNTNARFIVVLVGLVLLLGIVSFAITTTFQNEFAEVNKVQSDNDLEGTVEPSATSSMSPSTAPTAAPSLSPTFQLRPYLESVLMNVTTQNMSVSLQETSSVTKAIEWLVKYDPVVMNMSIDEKDTTERIIQRFGFAVIYYAMNERDVFEVDWMRKNECDSIHVSCNNEGFARSLGIVGCQAYGTIPPEIYYLNNLEHLIIASNTGLRGTIPVSIGKLTQLRQLGIYNNSIEGEIPNEIFHLKYLKYLNLSNNIIHGRLRPLRMFQSLEKLVLDNNMLTGTLSLLELNEALPLKVLSLSKNNLIGEIPSEIHQLEQIEHLYLDENDLEGPLPNEISLLKKLKSLALRDNRFTGKIPVQWGTLESLQFLTLGNNFLTGSLPISFGNLIKLKVFDIGGNNLEGSLQNITWTEATHLYLQSNLFTGTICDDFEGLSELVSLMIFDNNFYGTMPSSICNRTVMSNLLNLWADCNDYETNSETIFECECCTACFR